MPTWAPLHMGALACVKCVACDETRGVVSGLFEHVLRPSKSVEPFDPVVGDAT